MGHQFIVRIKELEKELAIVKRDYEKIKGKTTHNLMKAVKNKREQSRIDTEIACQKSLYFRWLESVGKASEFKNR